MREFSKLNLIISQSKMEDELLPIDWVETKSSIIKIIGVGGGGSNAVNYMSQHGVCDVDFVVCNTDEQDLKKSPISEKLQIGVLGAGGDPEIGRKAAMDSFEKIREMLDDGTKIVFLTAGMGGGTGTGATPIIAKIAQDLGILTVAIVTTPFEDEGEERVNNAAEGIKELKEFVDALLIINNEKLIEIYSDLTVDNAFSKADDILTVAAKSIAEVITRTGDINLDFADVKKTMFRGGATVIGYATACGVNRAREAVELALTSPLLNDNDITGARRILLNINTSAEKNLLTRELGEITRYVKSVAKNAKMIWGKGKDESLGDALSVTVIASDFSSDFAEYKGDKTKRNGDVPIIADDTFSREEIENTPAYERRNIKSIH